MKIYLASKSPRRQELLKQMGVHFDVLDINTPEEHHMDESPLAYSRRITHEKLLAAWQYIIDKHLPVLPVLCADTEVVMHNKIYGKPKDKEDAYLMLQSYSNNHHEVITSSGIKFHDFEQIETQTTTVYFGTILPQDIQDYLNLNEYLDKAGAYGIQGYFGQFIKKIEGCFYSVMGLSLYQVRELLSKSSKIDL